jgi:hypothetical protein
MVAGKTSRQTRSGSGYTKALRESFPRIRTLLDILYCCLQARLRTFPLFMGNRGHMSSEVKMDGKKSRIEITLHWTNAAFTVMPTL